MREGGENEDVRTPADARCDAACSHAALGRLRAWPGTSLVLKNRGKSIVDQARRRPKRRGSCCRSRSLSLSLAPPPTVLSRSSSPTPAPRDPVSLHFSRLSPSHNGAGCHDPLSVPSSIPLGSRSLGSACVSSLSLSLSFSLPSRLARPLNQLPPSFLTLSLSALISLALSLSAFLFNELINKITRAELARLS